MSISYSTVFACFIILSFTGIVTYYVNIILHPVLYLLVLAKCCHLDNSTSSPCLGLSPPALPKAAPAGFPSPRSTLLLVQTVSPLQKYLQLLVRLVCSGTISGAGVFVCCSASPTAASSSSYAFISSVEMYGARQMGHVVLRKTNQDTRHSEWNSWPQACNRRMASGSVGDSVLMEMSVGGVAVEGRIAASSTVGWEARRTGSGGEGACRAERHIAHSCSWMEAVSPVMDCA